MTSSRAGLQIEQLLFKSGHYGNYGYYGHSSLKEIHSKGRIQKNNGIFREGGWVGSAPD